MTPGQTDRSTCALCGADLSKSKDAEEAALAEARATFSPQELESAVSVCDGCWRLMRRILPDLDKRYSASPNM